METLLTRAFTLAAQLHAAQTRKTSIVPNTPYLGHLLEVAGIVQSNGAPEVAVAAALLHDAIEDQGAATRELIQDQLGPEVLALVEECTEPGTGGATKAPWRERKEGYLQQVLRASTAALLIKCADKLQNARDLRKQVYLEGEQAYAAFTRGKADKLWFYHTFVQTARERQQVLQQSQLDQPLLRAIDYLLIELDEVLTDLDSPGNRRQAPNLQEIGSGRDKGEVGV
ncbi:hypothetical protein KDW_62590 [Dictyobacter vulcani]|uniref:HD/PDEase domain-containing protein n=1 Tax=Dictyobacter vulcani TaxID=2607529 RepID=A0A5J4L018_9CHLR|nr:HD domain-containing protein [Dictyobacter vulcani]GER92097.1 hypothetical protein KDW_62590 [Dictyobacter vulcani]